MKVLLYNEQRDLPIAAPSVKRLVSFLFDLLRIPSDEIHVHFVTEKKICRLHSLFFNDPSSTDCISFPIDPPKKGGYGILGEVFICPKVAIAYAKTHQIDPHEEASRYLVHGILHLIGLDDIKPDERKKLRAKENKCMKLLTSHGLLLH